MKKVPYGLERSKLHGEGDLLGVFWDNLKLKEVGQAFHMSAASSVAIQFSGIFGEGGSVSLEGSVDGENYEVLRDSQGRAIRSFDKEIVSLGQMVRFIRPVVETGDLNTDITCSMNVVGRA